MDLQKAIEEANHSNILDVTGMNLTSLPNLPKSLTVLKCCMNALTSLPELPQSLTILHCSGNKLTKLPTLPQSLFELMCSSNQLTSLPNLPIHLESLGCYNNPWKQPFPPEMYYHDISAIRRFHTKQKYLEQILESLLGFYHIDLPLCDDIRNRIGSFLSSKNGSLLNQIYECFE